MYIKDEDSSAMLSKILVPVTLPPDVTHVHMLSPWQNRLCTEN